MADAKISQLPVATTPLAGTELVPVVQGGVTDQTTVEAILTGTVPSGTANGVLYLDGSKVVTSGSALTFDGTNFAIAGGLFSGDARLGQSGTKDIAVIVGNTAGSGPQIRALSFNEGTYAPLTSLASFFAWNPAGSESMRLTSTGLGIGTTTTSLGRLTVVGAASSSKFLVFDSNASYGEVQTYSAPLYLNRQGNNIIANLDGGNLGIGTSSPGAKLEVAGSIRSSSSIFAGYASGFDQTYIGSNGATGNGCVMATVNYANNAYQPISYDASVYLWRPNGTEAMRLDSSGNLGIGTSSPAEKLDTNGNIRVTGASNERSIGFNFYGVSQYNFYVDGSSDSARMAIRRGTTEVAVFDSSGDLGLGVTPALGYGRGIFLSQGGGTANPSLVHQAVNTNDERIYLTNNMAFAPSGFSGGYTYIKTNCAASYYLQAAGQHQWYTAPSGTAGNAISFTQAMTLDASGNLGVGTTNPGTWRLNVASGSVDKLRLNNTVGNGNTIDFSDQTWQAQITGSAGVLTFATGGTTERVRITSGGYLGIGGTPVAPLHILTGTRSLSLAALSGGGGASYLLMGNADSGGTAGPTVIVSANRNIQFGLGDSFSVDSGGTFSELARLSDSGNFQIGGSANRSTTTGTAQLMLFDGTAPVGTLSNGISIYSSSGEAYVMDAAGNATLFSPHDAETNEWIFRSKHTPTGKVLKIDVERLLKFVNDHFGLDAVHEFIEA